jgi:hypothetical protein
MQNGSTIAQFESAADAGIVVIVVMGWQQHRRCNGNDAAAVG